MIVDFDVEKSHLSDKQNQIPVSYIKLMLLESIPVSKSETQRSLKEDFLLRLK